MNSVRVSGLGEKQTVEQLKVYFSTPRNGGGRIQNIYFPLLNNDAVIVYEEEGVAAQVFSVEDHNVFGDEVDLTPLPFNVFTTVEATLDPAVASMVKATQRCEDFLRYICEVEILSEDNHNFRLRGDVYQIEMAWRNISNYMNQQRQIHSTLLSSSELQKEEVKIMENGNSSKNSRARRRQKIQTDIQDRELHKEHDSKVRQGSKSFGEIDLDRNSFRRDDSNAYLSHKYNSSEQHGAKPKIIPRQSLKNESRPSTTPRAEAREDSHRAEIDRIIQRTLEESRGKNSSTRSNESVNGLSHMERMDVSEPVAGLSHVRKDYPSYLQDYQYSSIGEPSHYVFPQNRQDSSDEEVMQINPNTERFSDANETFEKFSSLKVSQNRGKSAEKSTVKPKRNQSLKETDLLSLNRQPSSDGDSKKWATTSHKVPEQRELTNHNSSQHKEGSSFSHTPSGIDSMNSVLKDTEALLMKSSFAVEASINSFTFGIGHMKVKIYHGNITAVETAGLVNAANGSLANGAGVAGAIARAASPTMQQECDAYIKKFGILGTGEIMHTRAGGRLSMKVSHILHAVGPIWLDRLPDRCTYELTLTYLNVLKYADKLWLPSITLPCISSGIFGTPLEKSIQCFLDSLLLFASESRAEYHLKEVNLVNSDEDGVGTTIAILQSLLERDQDLLTAEAIDKFTKLQEKRKSTPKSLSKTISGNIGTKDDFHSYDYGKANSFPFTDSSKRRSSSLSRATAKGRQKEETSPRSLNIESNKRTKNSDLKVTGKSSSSSSSERKSRQDSAQSERGTTASRLAANGTSSGAKNSPRGPPTMKQSLVASPPGGGSKPKTKSSTGSRNTPMKASTLLPPEGNKYASARSSDAEAPRNEYGVNNIGDIEHHSLPANFTSHTFKEDKFTYCKICVNEIRNPKTLSKCDHTFCTDCISQYIKRYSSCPLCGISYSNSGNDASDGSLSARDTVTKSTQPAGTMTHLTRRNLVVPGYEYCEGAIEIHYDIPSGKQGKYDPLPRQPYTGVQHKAYLPNSAEGREVLRLLKQAFKANKVFRITSRGSIDWNITHKTKISSFSTDKSSYPDPLHLKRVKEEMSRKGIV